MISEESDMDWVSKDEPVTVAGIELKDYPVDISQSVQNMPEQDFVDMVVEFVKRMKKNFPKEKNYEIKKPINYYGYSEPQ